MMLEGKMEDASINFKKALQLKPDYLEPKDNLDRLSASGKNDLKPQLIPDVKQ